MRVGSLFSGIGGLELGLERAGMEVAWQVENDPFCNRVLEKHWPNVTRYGDIEGVNTTILPSVDLVCGGFPCPVVSQAARGRNNAEWLWPHFWRIVHNTRPAYVVLEKVPGLLYSGRGFGDILGDLAFSGYDATWNVFPASAFGAPHRRSRVWLVAYADRDREPDLSIDAEASELSEFRPTFWERADLPGSVRVDDGLRDHVDRNRALGNAVVPQVSEWIGRRIMEVT